MASVSMKKYLKRYLSSDSGDSKKKASKKKTQQLKQGANKLIDDDIDLKMIKGGFQEIEDLELGEDAPQIADIVDERPLHVRAEEQFSSEKWKAVGPDENSPDLYIKREPKSPVKSRQDSNYDSDQSPPRHVGNADSDQSPPRHAETKPVLLKASEIKQEKQNIKYETTRHDSDSDLSPARVHGDSDGDLSPPRSSRRNDSESSVKKPGDEILPKRDMEGRIAGLQSAKHLKRELQERRRLDDEEFNQIDPEILGINAKTQVRDKKRKLEKARRLKERLEREKEREAKYAKWGKGLKQQEMTLEKMQSDLHEMSKPLARYRDDADLDQHLRNQDRDGDPMLEFLKKKRKNNEEEKPKFTGPMSPNRFNIPPGFRWDGVDRSSGFELQRFKRLANRKVNSEDTYKWSIEEM